MGYVLRTSGRHQIGLAVLAAGVFGLTSVPLEIQRRIVADQPELFGMIANRTWAMRDYVKGFEFSPIRFTGEVDLYPLWIDT